MGEHIWGRCHQRLMTISSDKQRSKVFLYLCLGVGLKKSYDTWWHPVNEFYWQFSNFTHCWTLTVWHDGLTIYNESGHTIIRSYVQRCQMAFKRVHIVIMFLVCVDLKVIIWEQPANSGGRSRELHQSYIKPFGISCKFWRIAITTNFINHPAYIGLPIMLSGKWYLDNLTTYFQGYGTLKSILFSF